MNIKVKYWTELSEYHMKTAEAMLQSKRYLYVGFMAHQAIEKILKAPGTRWQQNRTFFAQSFAVSQKSRYL